MLMMIGPVRFRVAPVNVTEYSHVHGATFAEKAVIGARPPLEFMGNGPESWTIRAIIFPQRFGDGGGLAILAMMRASGIPQYMLRGDGSLMGWVVIETVTERSSYLSRNGVGQVVEVDIGLRRSAAPSAAGFFAALSGLFSGVF